MSDTVKVVIEISKATYKDLKSGNIYSSLCEAPQGLVEGIQNGTPLDTIKAEIEKLPTDYCGGYIGLSKEEVLGILDSIGEGARNESACM